MLDGISLTLWRSHTHNTYTQHKDIDKAFALFHTHMKHFALVPMFSKKEFGNFLHACVCVCVLLCADDMYCGFE